MDLETVPFSLPPLWLIGRKNTIDPNTRRQPVPTLLVADWHSLTMSAKPVGNQDGERQWHPASSGP
jgi:hypothetical protein